MILAGCGGDAEQEVPSPLADCDGLTAPPAAAAPAPAGTGKALPELELPCFTGGEPFALGDLAGPAVVTLWASWCPPCRKELPELQRYADAHADQVHVVGVVTNDDRSKAASLAEGLSVTFPALDDPDTELLDRVDAIALPVTLFVDAAGQVRYLHQAGDLDAAAVEGYVAEHLAAGP